MFPRVIKAVIFDYGGVVKSSYGQGLKNIARAYRVTEEKLKEVIFPHLDYFSKGLIDEDKFWTSLSRALGKPVPADKYQLWRKGYEQEFSVYPEITALVKKLKNSNIKTAILSNTIKPHVEIVKKHHGYCGFDVLVLSCEVGLRKPEKEIYQLTLKKLNVKPSECIFVDNKKESLGPAQELGMRTILAKNPRQVVASVIKLVYGSNA